jgi:hypothetical protein
MAIRKLGRLLRSAFPGALVRRLGRPPGGDRIGGVLVWGGFEGLDQIDRQRELWAVLRRDLTPEEQAQISLLMTVTPREFELITAD